MPSEKNVVKQTVYLIEDNQLHSSDIKHPSLERDVIRFKKKKNEFAERFF